MYKIRHNKFIQEIETPAYVINIASKDDRFYSSIVYFDIDDEIGVVDCIAPINLTCQMTASQVGFVYSLSKISTRNKEYRMFVYADLPHSLNNKWVDIDSYSRLEIDGDMTLQRSFCGLFLSESGVGCIAKESQSMTVIKNFQRTTNSKTRSELRDRKPTILLETIDQLFVGVKASVDNKQLDSILLFALENKLMTYAFVDQECLQVLPDAILKQEATTQHSNVEVPVLSLDRLVEERELTHYDQIIADDSRIPALNLNIDIGLSATMLSELHKCVYCSREFNKKFGLSNHVRTTHFEHYEDYKKT